MSSQNTKTSRNNILNEWNNLTIANRFIFAKVMTDRDLCTELIRSILPDLPIDHIEYVEYEKDAEAAVDSKSVRLDVYTRDEEGRAFDLEMQITYYDYLPRRSRYYGTMLDETLLQHGLNYPELNDAYVIFICPFDMFGQNRYIYHFMNLCLDNPDLALGDGQHKIFLNAKGEIGDISENLRAFLKLVAGGSPENAFADKIESAVMHAKHNSVWRREYMIWRADMDLELEIERNKAIKEGLAEGREEGEAKGRKEERIQNISNLLKNGVSIDILYDTFGKEDVDKIREQIIK